MDNPLIWLSIIIAASAAGGGFKKRGKSLSMVLWIVALLSLAACVALLKNG